MFEDQQQGLYGRRYLGNVDWEVDGKQNMSILWPKIRILAWYGWPLLEDSEQCDVIYIDRE